MSSYKRTIARNTLKDSLKCFSLLDASSAGNVGDDLVSSRTCLLTLIRNIRPSGKKIRISRIIPFTLRFNTLKEPCHSSLIFIQNVIRFGLARLNGPDEMMAIRPKGRSNNRVTRILRQYHFFRLTFCCTHKKWAIVHQHINDFVCLFFFCFL